MVPVVRWMSRSEKGQVAEICYNKTIGTLKLRRYIVMHGVRERGICVHDYTIR